MTHPNYEAWRSRHLAAINSGFEPEGVTAILEGLPLQAQKALKYGCPWALDVEPAVSMMMDLFDLLDDDKNSLSDLGIGVKRAMAFADLDWANRSEKFAAAFHEYFLPAYRSNCDQALAAAATIDPDAVIYLLFLDSRTSQQRVSVKAGAGQAEAAYLCKHGFATMTPVRDFHWIEITSHGRDVARHLKAIEAMQAEIFAGARCSLVALEEDGGRERILRTALLVAANSARSRQ